MDPRSFVLGPKHARNERRTWFVVALTAVMMVFRDRGGNAVRSMALLADGWHMATHAAALGIAGLAYLFARRQAANAHFTFGTGKFGDLAAFASAIILGSSPFKSALRAWRGWLARFRSPMAKRLRSPCSALPSISSARGLLRDDHHGHHHHGHDHSHGHHHDKQSSRCLCPRAGRPPPTSVLAIAALVTRCTCNGPGRIPRSASSAPS